MNFEKARKKEAIIDMFKGMCELNCYSLILPKETSSPRKNLLDGIFDEIDCNGNYYLYGTAYEETEDLKLAAVLKGRTDTYAIAELVNLVYKMYFFLNEESIQIRINDITLKNEKCKHIIEELDNLGIPTVYDKKTEVEEPYDKDISFDIIIDDKKVAHGGVNRDLAISYILISVEESIKTIEIEDKETPTDVYLFPETQDVFSDALTISTELKDCGFKTEVDYSLNKDNIKKIDVLKYRSLITFNESDIKKYTVKLTLLSTKEVHDVSIENLVEELNLL